MLASFPRLTAAIQNGIDRNLHTGVQVYVSVDGRVVLNQGFGEASPGVDLDSSTIMLWRSAGKPITAVAIMQLVDEKSISLCSPLSAILPETRSTPIGLVTVQQLLTHTSGIPLMETGWPNETRDHILQKVLSTTALHDNEAAYQPQNTWFLLGEILRRVSSVEFPFAQLIAERIFQKLEVGDVWCGIPNDDVAANSARLPVFYERTRGQLQISDYSSGAWLAEASPGGNLRGPVSGLGRFYEMLLRKGVAANGHRIVSEQSAQQLIQRHRINRFDETLQHIVDFGLGVIVDSNRYGESTVPYGFGRHCSEDSFGHGGSQCSIGFCDPVQKLVVAWAANAFCGEGQHQRRNRAINEAVYEDLGLAAK